MDHLAASELILNGDGSIYHLNLLPRHISDTILLVGDPDRVDLITRNFDEVEFSIRKREFHTQTGSYKGKRLTVVSTGIGTDNIDIVLNELDALVNIDLETRQIRPVQTALDIIRVGTSGSIQKNIPVDSLVISSKCVGFDSLLHFYKSDQVQLQEMARALEAHLKLPAQASRPYIVPADTGLLKKFLKPVITEGFTGTNVGFYGPQGRKLRLALRDPQMMDRIASFEYDGARITNLEMETAGIYGLGKLLGHRTLSVNAIIANRTTGAFSEDSSGVIEKAIAFTLDTLVEP